MKCLNCGKTTDTYLCHSCQTPQILDKVFHEISTYQPESCENPYLVEYVSKLTEKYEERSAIPDILNLFDPEISAFYFCRYYRITRDPHFEESALTYIQTHAFSELHTQHVLYDLIDSYLPNDFNKPQRWCERIAKTTNLCCELYAIASRYFSMIGEYDLADTLADQAIKLCNNGDAGALLFSTPEKMLLKLSKQKDYITRYRTIKPYWPVTEERRRAVAVFYDRKGISYPRIECKPKKVSESDFAPLREYLAEKLTDYCAFWCAEAFSLTAAKGIYQIAAVKVRNGTITEHFQQFVRPWDSGPAAKKAAAKEAGVPLADIESAEDVDLVLSKFFAFVGEDVLVSTGALGNQAKLLSRATRYAGRSEISNEFFDLLDLAAEISPEFDLDHNTREYLLDYFSIEEGKSALDKARINKNLYDALLRCGGSNGT